MQERPILSSLFVDFDNIFSNLHKQDPGMAHNFATQPEEWLKWLTNYLKQADERPRRIAVRYCYLNPKPFGQYRPYFMRAGFEVVDCPALTALGKTSADVRIVIDMLELLDFKATYEEFILLSADADFTPVLLKLRKRGCGTALLAVGNSSPMYRASCDNIIDQSVFISQVLTSTPPTLVVEPTPAPAWNEDYQPDKRSRPTPSGAGLSPSDIEALSRRVKEYVSAAGAPVAKGGVADLVRSFRPDIGQPDWAGYGSFGALLGQLRLPGIETSPVGPGYLYDPQVHEPPAGHGAASLQTRIAERYPHLAATVIKVTDLTDIPVLTPEQYGCLFTSIADEVNKNGYSMTPVSKAVRDRCKDAKLDVPRKDVNWVLTALTYSGYRFGAETENADRLAVRYYENALNLCEKSFLQLTPDELQQMYGWLVGKEWQSEPDGGLFAADTLEGAM